ncbi:MAG: transposase family protein [Selenomonadaceae bacterium]|nr:transposase family protein [Selenomonadaceae bacterium]
MQKYFAIIEDQRYQGFVKHKLSDILTIVACAVLCGERRETEKAYKLIAFTKI